MPPVLLDRQGHLTGAGVALVSRAPVGKAPTDLATHLAACAQCQERMLAGAEGSAAARPERRPPPPPWRIWVILGVIVLVLLSTLEVLRRLR